MDGEANLTSEDDTSRHPMDGREATHNPPVAALRPAGPGVKASWVRAVRPILIQP
jgi:hypothetical protein